MKPSLRIRPAIKPLVLCGILAGLLNAATAADAENFVRVPKTAAKPEFAAGPFRSSGWEKSVAFCGMRDANTEGAVAVGKDGSWWIAYDDEALFLVFLTSLKPEGEMFPAVAAAKYGDAAIFQGDHIVVLIAAGADPSHHLKLAVNPYGALWARQVTGPDDKGKDVPEGVIRVGNHLGPHHIPGLWWIVRLRIPFDVLGLDSLDGKSAKVHLAWSSAPLYLSWGGTKPGEWDKAPTVYFDPDSQSAFRLNGTFPFLLSPDRGNLNIDFRGKSFSGEQPAPSTVGLAIRNEVAGETTFDKKFQPDTADDTGSKFSEHLTVAVRKGEENRLLFEVFDGGEKPVFRNPLPFLPGNPDIMALLQDWESRHSGQQEAASPN